MTTSGQEIRGRVIDSVRSTDVAIAAGKTPAVWASTTIPHVFAGDAGYIGGRNRGRCPFVEVWVERQNFDRTTVDGGTLQSQIRLRVHAAGRDARDLVETILVAALAAIRNEVGDTYLAIGDDEISDVKPGPMGWAVDAVITVENSWDRVTYEAH